MASSDANSVLQRKMDASRATSTGGGRTAAAALRLALARSADELFDLAVSVIGVLQARVAGDELTPFLPDERMQVLLDGPDGKIGALSVDQAFLAALIQQQTMGRLTGALPEVRAFTGTDAAMTAPLIDEALKQAAGLAKKTNDIQCLKGFRFGALAEDARAVTLAMEADKFRVFDLTLEFAEGPLQAAMSLMLPEPKDSSDTVLDESEYSNTTPIRRVVEMARADLNAVICRMKLPLADLSAMQPGDVLPLMQDDLEHTDLFTITGEKVSSGRLGQIGGMRAVRLNETHPPVTALIEQTEFLADIGAQTPATDQLAVTESADHDVSQDIATVEHGGVMDIAALEETESDDAFLEMTPEQAAVEISALAGLPLEDNEQNTLPAPVI